jgi:hypothetical protein
MIKITLVGSLLKSDPLSPICRTHPLQTITSNKIIRTIGNVESGTGPNPIFLTNPNATSHIYPAFSVQAKNIPVPTCHK